MTVDIDPFTFMVEQVDANDRVGHALGGATSISAAHAIIEAYVQIYGESKRLILRQSGRIIRREQGTKG